MTILTYVALFGSLFALAIGIATILGEGGWAFDLRRRRARRRRNRAGGRRGDDWMHLVEHS